MMRYLAVLVIVSLAVNCGEDSKPDLDIATDASSPAGDRLEGPPADLTVGANFTCFLDESAAAHCFGRNPGGAAVPPANVRFSSISAGSGHVCGIIIDTGETYCWGFNEDGQASPPQIKIATVAGGYETTCGLQTNGSPICWGKPARIFRILPVLLPWVYSPSTSLWPVV